MRLFVDAEMAQDMAGEVTLRAFFAWRTLFMTPASNSPRIVCLCRGCAGVICGAFFVRKTPDCMQGSTRSAAERTSQGENNARPAACRERKKRRRFHVINGKCGARNKQ